MCITVCKRSAAYGASDKKHKTKQQQITKSANNQINKKEKIVSLQIV
jgi:hypothetical protein